MAEQQQLEPLFTGNIELLAGKKPQYCIILKYCSERECMTTYPSMVCDRMVDSSRAGHLLPVRYLTVVSPFPFSAYTIGYQIRDWSPCRFMCTARL